MTSRPSQRLFFCHIPKTGGLTLRSLLGEHFHQREIFPYGEWRDIPHDMPLSDVQGYRLYMGHYVYSVGKALLGERLVSITMLRNPIDRVLSAYDHVRRDTNHLVHQKIGGVNATLEDFLRENPYGAHANTHVLFLTPIKLTAHTLEAARRAYAELLRSTSQTNLSLEGAKEVLEQMEFFGITERHEDSMRMLNHALGWAPPGSYESVNVGHGRKRAEDFPQEMLDRLAETNRLDLELYEYGKQLFERRYREFVTRLEWDSYVARTRTQRWERPRETLISVEDAHEARGWHARQVSAQGANYRWSGPGTNSVFYARVAPAKRMELSVGVNYVLLPEILDNLQIRINGADVAFRKKRDFIKGLHILQGEFDGALVDTADGMTTIEFIVPKTVSPHELDSSNGDTRKMGIACSWVKIQPK